MKTIYYVLSVAGKEIRLIAKRSWHFGDPNSPADLVGLAFRWA